MSTIIWNYIDLLRKRFQSMDSEEREAVLIEVRDYLDQESERLRNQAPGMEKDDAVRDAIRDFGDPEDIAIFYDGSNEVMTVLNQRTDEALLDIPLVTHSVQGRVLSTRAHGLRLTINYRTATVLGVLGLAAAFIVGALFLAGQDVPVQGEADRPVYSHQTFGMEDWTASPSGQFSLQEGAAAVLQVDLIISSGCAHVQLVGPTGDVAFDSGDVCSAELLDEVDFTGAGEWTVQITLTDASGDVSVAAYKK